MAYEKQGFHSGEKLKASQLSAMEDGIIEAEKLAMEGAAGAANMEKGIEKGATQQIPDNVAEGFDFTNRNSIAAEIDDDVEIWNSGEEQVPYGATGEFAAAFGGKSAAIGKRSFAEGTTTIAKGKYSHAEGDNAVALGNQSHAEGYATTAAGLSSHAEGVSTLTNAEGAHAEGVKTIAIGYAAHAEGGDTVAEGIYSHAEGNHTEARHNNSHAGGFHTKTGAVDQTVLGRYNSGKTDTLFEVGDGQDEDDRRNAFEVYSDGLVAIGDKVQQLPRKDKVTQTEGEETLHFNFVGYERAKEITGKESDETVRMQYGAIGNYSASMNGRSAALNKHALAVNNSTIAKGEESFAAGYETIAEGNGSSAFGSRTWAKGKESHTEGILTLTEGEGSHAEGSLTKAKGNYSHAEGYLTETGGLYSHAEGSATQTGGFSAHAEGNETLADTDASHTEGSGTKVISYIVVDESGDNGSSGGAPEDAPNYNDYESIEDYRRRAAACSHAEGNNTTAMGYSSHAEGVGTNAYGRSSHVEGWGTQTGELVEGVIDGQTYKAPNPEKGMAAHADGYNTKAIANYSHASGFETVADRESQTVVGQYNKKISHLGSLFVVGAGNNDAERINGLEVIQGGEVVIRWEGAYYSLNLMLNLIANAHGGPSFFDLAKKQ